MAIPLNAKHERLIAAQIASGRFRSVDEVLDEALSTLPHPNDVPPSQSLLELFEPLHGLDLDSSRNPSPGRSIEL